MASSAAAFYSALGYEFDPLDLHQQNPRRYPFLLESAARGTSNGRYDILFAYPEESIALSADYTLGSGGGRAGGRFLGALDATWRESRSGAPAGVPGPFHGGWFLLLGYELATEIEPVVRLAPSPSIPVALAVRVPVAVVRDHLTRRAWIVAEPGREACAAGIKADVESAVARARAPVLDGVLEEEPDGRFLDAVAAVRRHIAAGDIFQANLARIWQGRLAGGATAADVYRRLREANPAPFAGIAAWNDFAVVSSSPERLLRAAGDEVETRPIAGTRPRTVREPDHGIRQELLDHPKERAEHVMLIDLERNDLGRICRAGSVDVSEYMTIESYRHVHHIVSNVRGRLRAGATPGAIIRAVFPGGTITGCPKVRCMQIIDKLEGRPRGFYTGAMGYLNRDGSADLNILIRTITIDGRELSFAAGSGIVADSEPDAELAETRAKAKGMLLALGDD